MCYLYPFGQGLIEKHLSGCEKRRLWDKSLFEPEHYGYNGFLDISCEREYENMSSKPLPCDEPLYAFDYTMKLVRAVCEIFSLV